jgi:UDP-N-acetylmuramate--alanine ligase
VTAEGKERIGAGLAPARAPRAIRSGERIHVVGAAGAGASAAALLGARSGAVVSGCDPGGPSPYTPALVEAGIPLAWRHAATHVTDAPGPDRLAITKALTAIDPDHPELLAARAAGIPLEAWQQVVADAAVGRNLIAIAGTHGKSTTAGWLVHVLVSAGADPAAFVGALLPSSLTGGTPATARWGGGGAFVVEADEYAGNFDPYQPRHAVVTNVDWDHPDVFADRAAVVDALTAWLERAQAAQHEDAPALYVNVADAGGADLARRLRDGWAGPFLVTALVDAAAQRQASYAKGLAEEYARADHPAGVLIGRIVEQSPEATVLQLVSPTLLREPLTLRLALAGRHNAANAVGVAASALGLGIAPQAIATGIAGFAGVGRRLERKGEAAGVVVYDDYGHHPAAIRATITALRQREPRRRVWAVYEPLTYHRTAVLLDAFADALGEADAVAIADIWAGRDRDTTITSAGALADAVARRRPELPVAAPGSVEATADWLADEVRSGDAVLVLGGGRSYRIGERLLERLAGD